MIRCPEIPVGDLLEETLVECGTVEGLLPSGVELDEVGELVVLVKCAERKIKEDLNMRPVRVGEPDVLDERDFLQYVLRLPRACEGGG